MIFQTLILFTLMLIIPISSIVFKKQYIDKTSTHNRKVHYLFTIGLTLFMTALVFISLKLDNIPLTKVGITTVKYNPFSNKISTAIFILLMFIIIINYKLTLILKKVIENKLMPCEKLNELKKVLPTNQSDKLCLIFIAFNAGICEEIIYRGFLTHYISSMVHINQNSIIVIIVVSFIFALAHACQGIGGAVNSFILGVLWTTLYFNTGSLLLPMIFHILYDLKMILYPYVSEIEYILNEISIKN